MRSKWAAGKAVRAGLAVGGRISKSIRNRSRRRGTAAGSFSTQPFGPRPVGCFSVPRPRDSLGPYRSRYGRFFELEVRSEIGEGTTVTVRIPLRRRFGVSLESPGVISSEFRELVSCSRSKHIFRCDQNGPPARREEGAYPQRYVTDEQRSRRPIFIATLRAAAGWLFFRPAAAGLAPHVSIQICSSLAP